MKEYTIIDVLNQTIQVCEAIRDKPHNNEIKATLFNGYLASLKKTLKNIKTSLD